MPTQNRHPQAFWPTHCNASRSRNTWMGEVLRRMDGKILLVDDSQTTLLMVEMLLKQHTSYEVVIARNGAEALARAVVEKPDLILMDVVMPKMDGFQACRAMRKQESLRDVPIILVTSRGEPCNVEAGFESGCTDYVTKPVDSIELLEIVSGYLASQKTN